MSFPAFEPPPSSLQLQAMHQELSHEYERLREDFARAQDELERTRIALHDAQARNLTLEDQVRSDVPVWKRHALSPEWTGPQC